tara:strand:+ start:52 stop:459 length:408 start_codon:yes stop_codon:yes gene_type:complete
MNYWHLNTCNLINKNSMLTHNLGYIGLGTIHDNEYQTRIKRPGTTPCQFKLFQQKAKNGDIIFLYHNKVGYIAYGEYNGIVKHSTIAPGWSDYEIQKHLIIKKWNKIDNPSTKNFRRKTLVIIKQKDYFNSLITL